MGAGPQMVVYRLAVSEVRDDDYDDDDDFYYQC